jgi:signal transduction histidine kinase
MEASERSAKPLVDSGYFESTRPDYTIDDLTNEVATEPVVLMIEDDEASRAFARAVLEESGYRVFSAGSGIEGIATFQQVRPQCVLLDARMPNLDGYETCRRLRALDDGAEVPIVFMTAERNVDCFDHAFACGADDFLTKPVTPGDLVNHVRSGLALWRVRTSHDYSLVKGQRDQLLRRQLQQERLNLLLVHDLKAPLNSIGLLAQGLLRGKGLASSDREAVEEIWRQARGMASMVLDLLDIGKAREGKLTADRQSVDLRELIEQLLLGFRAIARSHDVELQSSIFVPPFRIDEKLLRRLLANLIDNALEHAPRGSTVQVIASPKPNSCEIRVVDAGPGIPIESRAHVFEAFSRAGKARGDRRGLGLNFCRLAAEAHGGHIRVEDGSPGCIMCVELPRD